jgi:antirestriction protein
MVGVQVAPLFSSVDEARQAIEENYCGCYSSLADYAQELTEQTITIPENLSFYIDYERMARDMEMGGEFSPLSIS